MDAPSDRRLLAYCLLAALVGVPASIALFPDDGETMLVLPIAVLAVLMLADGYASAP